MRQEVVDVSRVLREKYRPEDVAGLEQELDRVFNVEIAYQLLIEVNPNASHDEAEQLLNTCKGNPWDVPIMYQLLKIKN